MMSTSEGQEPHLFIPLARETVDVLEAQADPLVCIEKVAWMRQWVEDVLQEFVEQARRSGHGWNEIARALGVSRQAAWQRYRTEDDDVRRAGGDDLLRSDEIWSILLSKMRHGRWYELQELYVLVAEQATLSDADLGPDSPGSNSPRWERNIRNVLQRRKSLGDIDWDGRGRYRLK